MKYFLIEDKNLLICWNSKCGSTTIKSLILKYYNKYEDEFFIHKKFKIF